VWELALVPKRPRKWPQKVRLGALWTEIAGALAEGGAPGIPGVAVPRERLQRLTKPPVATVFQSAWLAPGPWTPPERLHAWDRFSGLHRRAQHDGAEVAAHWPTAEVRDIKSGCLYGHHSKAVSFLLDDDSEFAQDTKGTVLMESHYLQWLLARRRLAHGLPALTDEDLKAVFTESSHQKYLRWLEGALRGGPAAS